MTLPTLYLIGAPKAGTTSVASWLGQHPGIYWSVPNEPYYWASDLPGQRAHYGFDTRERYEQLYASAEATAATVRGDGSTTYLYSDVAVPDILREVPDARFVVCVRDPVRLLISYHRTQVVALNEDEPDFACAWRRSLAGRGPGTTPLDPRLVDYPLVGRLGAALARVSSLIPMDQLHTVVFDDLVADPASTYRGLLEFAGVDRTVDADLAARNASDKMFRSPVLRRLTHRPPGPLGPAVRRLRQWSRTTSAPGVGALKQRMWRTEHKPTADAATLTELAAYFREDVALLEETIGRRMPGWLDAAP